MRVTHASFASLPALAHRLAPPTSLAHQQQQQQQQPHPTAQLRSTMYRHLLGRAVSCVSVSVRVPRAFLGVSGEIRQRRLVSSSSSNEFDVCVIGGGPSGYAAAMRAYDFGKQVCLIEKDRVGGAGVYDGAMSSKVRACYHAPVQSRRAQTYMRIACVRAPVRPRVRPCVCVDYVAVGTRPEIGTTAVDLEGRLDSFALLR